MQKKKKFLLVLPLLVIPFLTFAFWALGGGKKTNDQPQQNAGLNLELPGASLKDDKAVDKLGYYEKAAADSDHLKELKKNDPYLKSEVSNDAMPDHSMEDILPPAKYVAHNPKAYADPNEEKVYKKLAQLNSAMNANEKVTKEKNAGDKIQTVNGVDVDRLEQMMQTMKEGNNEDAEMKQLNGMMEKILDIQHPERVKEKIKEHSVKNKGKVFPLMASDDDNISVLDTLPPAQADTINFYSLSDYEDSETHTSIAAVIDETETLVSGSTVKLRITDDVYINGILIPKDNFIFGTASLNGERLIVTINTIRYQNTLLPVALSIYDLDGMEGIYIPGAIERDVAKQSADNALQNI
ncbi:MAG: conjugative transposon protein TraM, partial [Bacteroidota bacterium]|nr:conjugative transposon protein TraM [Bacteroidota bacterium]